MAVLANLHWPPVKNRHYFEVFYVLKILGVRVVGTVELENAITSLQNALAAPKNDITRDATIQRFEFCVELSWKVAKKVMGTASSVRFWQTRSTHY